VQSEAYDAAFKLPDMMNYFLAAGTLSITFIPLFSAYLARDEEAQGWKLFSTVDSLIGLILTIVTLVSKGFGKFIKLTLTLMLVASSQSSSSM
tara:strand:+ start:979 stop:1257 length:279 start_codon:yes stop_codon:yes gene_type:complete